MSYLVSLSLDLKPASQGKYEIVNEIMSANGLFRFINSSSGNKVDLPNNTYIGEFEGEGAAKVRSDLAAAIEQAFKEKGVESHFFIAVGSGWAWSSRAT
ncbi:TPA: hypothetical protein L4810_006779 [Pseudomonas aeruginosa]|uniref:hypothetical protein n=1 Tax=Pseudomonas TaxID=286 RepID=UPI000AEFCBF7|nr:hypothetical protein [Pseudomonas aeruginosa]EIU2570064.1 hypothetical protein [Pseudomonas aeruginosa]EIU2674718.1 hypothetical protein [Pseudomonas aeruginosa]EIU2725213.1 hypothetical protein [Pseudomonas aeruginosa]EIU2834817.1 hypothetical protein [Pseudomonas aeruginosa]EIU2838658.1 hypothetical protein [Pseudomonas aeruginosa]